MLLKITKDWSTHKIYREAYRRNHSVAKKIIKGFIAPMLGFQYFRSASRILRVIEAFKIVKKRQVKNLNYSGLNEAKYIN